MMIEKRVGQKSVTQRVRFCRPTSAQLSRAIKADKISELEPTQPLRLALLTRLSLKARTFVPASLWFSWIKIAYCAMNYR